MEQGRLVPLNFKQWIDENRASLKPPVGNKEIWPNREFMVTMVGGPNSRTDYHINEGEEFFYQLEGTLTLKILEKGQPKDVLVHAGEIFLLPAKVPHSPRRPAGSLGMVIERRRLPHELDTLRWLCPQCATHLYEESFHLTDLTTQLQPVFARFYGDPKHCTCPKCGHRTEKP